MAKKQGNLWELTRQALRNSNYQTSLVAQYGVTGFVDELNGLGEVCSALANKYIMAYEDFSQLHTQESKLSDQWKVRPTAYLRTPPTIHQCVLIRNPNEFPPGPLGFLFAAHEPPATFEMTHAGTIVGKLDFIVKLDLKVRPVYYFEDWVSVLVE